MGLKGVPGLRISKSEADTNGKVAKANAPKRPREDGQQSKDGRPTRRTGHQGMPGSFEQVQLSQINSNRARPHPTQARRQNGQAEKHAAQNGGQNGQSKKRPAGREGQNGQAKKKAMK